MNKEKTNESQFMDPVQTSKKYAMEGRYKHDSWYVKLDAASKSSETTMDAIEQVYHLAKKIRATIHADSRTTKSLNKILCKIRNGQVLLSGDDTMRAFICEGDLVKRCRTWFTDRLVYAHQSTKGDYKVHAELPLDVVKLVVNFPHVVPRKAVTSTALMFQIVHPKKSFWVIAPDFDSKKKWIDDISTAIKKFTGREA